MGTGPLLTRRFDNLELLVEVVRSSDRRLTVTELAAAANDHLGTSHLDGRWVARQIGSSEGRLHLADDGTVEVRTLEVATEPVEASGSGQALRLVALDFETLPRHAPDGSLLRLPLEAGALRFGHDERWLGELAPLSRTVAVDESLAALPDPSPRLVASLAEGREPALVAAELAQLLEGADVVVAYNGIEVDFPVLDDLLALVGTSTAKLGVVAVDALYLAHAILPDRTPVEVAGKTRGAHELVSVSHRLGHEVGQTHRALDDCELLAEVCRRLASRYAAMGGEVRTLFDALTRTSHAWALLADLAEPGRVRERSTAEEARDAIDELLAALPAARDTDGPAAGDHDAADDGSEGADLGEPATFQVPENLRAAGRIDPFELAVAIGGRPQRRPAQERTASHVAAALEDRHDVLVEAPTGSGKSLVLLASALDWISSAPGRRAVISTYTRALQTQLAGDIEALSAAIPGLEGEVDLVKGSANRLSLRALTTATVGLATGVHFRYGLSRAQASDPAFAELVAYLLLRLADLDSSSSLVTRWTAWSVDTADLPAAFELFTDSRLSGLTRELSQGRSGDFRAGDTTALAPKTLRVREALRRRRLIVANHALLCSASSVFTELAEHGELLLLADEAHELEHAATSTLSATLSTRELERLQGELVSIATAVADQLTDDDPPAAGDSDGEEGGTSPAYTFVAAVARLHQLVDDEALTQRLAAAFGLRPGTDVTLARRRQQVVIAEANADLGQLRIAGEIEPVTRLLRGLLGAAAANLEDATARLPATRSEEVATVKARLDDTLAALVAIASDLAELAGADDDGDGGGDVTLELPLDDGGPDHDAPAGGQGDNRLVWAAELELKGRELARFLDSGMRLRYWPVELTTTPVAVADDPRFVRFRSAFTVSVFVSGTLTVPGAADPWAFIRDRLGFADQLAHHVVDSDFDPPTQARLVAFSDFPSWAEQADAAVATVAWQVDRFARTTVDGDGRFGAMVLTTSRAHAGQIADAMTKLRRPEDRVVVHDARLEGNQRALTTFKEIGGVLIGTRGLWQGVDVPAEKVRLVWVNKLPFPPVGDPVTEVRRVRVAAAARDAGERDPELVARERYYLPLAAMALRQAVGRLLRSQDHRGVVVISDSKLAGDTALRRSYRRFFLASLPGFAADDGSGEPGSGNVVTMEEGWSRIWSFLATTGRDPERSPAAISAAQATGLSTPDALAEHVWLPHTRRVLAARFVDDAEVERFKASGRFTDELLVRAREVGGALNLEDGPLESLRDAQVDALEALAAGRDVMALLPTGYGKSFLFQLPGLILPGVTIVISPLVSLMTDQAMKLNRTVGGRVRALTGPMAESNSRLGKSQVYEQLIGTADHDIKIVYLAPERFATTQFQQMVRAGVRAGIVRRIAVDEAHTLAAWGDTFRPQMRRAEHYLRRLREDFDGSPQLLAVTATATRSVRGHLLDNLFAAEAGEGPGEVQVVQANPVRADMAVYKRLLTTRGRAVEQLVPLLVERLLEIVDGHAIVYATRIMDVEEIHAYLAAQIGRRRRVLKYHGRMSDLEKASVSNYFASAPRADDPEGFEPMVVVATKAFGLGIDRPDIRLVVASSPPGDLAEVYQALGRAGRDQADRDPSDAPKPTHGVALLSQSSWQTLRYFNRYDRDHDRLVRRFVDVFRTVDSPVELEEVVAEVIDERVARGELSPELVARRRDRLEESYLALAVRTFAALAAAGNLDDLGNSPAAATILPTERTGTDTSEAGQLAAHIASLLTNEEMADGVELTDLFDRLAVEVRARVGDVSALWFELFALDTVGLLDVKQITATGDYRTQLNFRRLDHWRDDTRLVGELARLHRERAEDLQRLREWFVNERDCALEGIAEFFDVDDWQRDACEHDHTRCSVCWDAPGPAALPHPDVLEVLRTDESMLAAGAAQVTRTSQRRLEEALVGILTGYRGGLGAAKLLAAVKGEGRVVYRGSFSKPLPRGVVNSRHFGQVPSATDMQVNAILARLVAAGTLVKVAIVDGQVVEVDDASGAFFRLTSHHREA